MLSVLKLISISLISLDKMHSKNKQLYLQINFEELFEKAGFMIHHQHLPLYHQSLPNSNIVRHYELVKHQNLYLTGNHRRGIVQNHMQSNHFIYAWKSNHLV